MRSSRYLLAVVGLTALLAIGTGAAGARPLEYAGPSGIHSYYEGLRGSLPLWTSATPDDPLGSWINPAALGTGRSRGLGFLITATDTTFPQGTGYSLAFGSVGFGYERMRSALGRDESWVPSQGFETHRTERYTVNWGARLGKGFFLGTSYSWHASGVRELDGDATWSVGAIVRPLRELSLGVVARDLNSPDYGGTKFRPIIEGALGFRPWAERMTVFVSLLGRTKKLEVPGAKAQPATFLSYGLQFEPFDGWVIGFGADEDQNINLSLGFHSANLGLGYANSRLKTEDGVKRDYGNFALSMGSDYRRNALSRINREYLEIYLRGPIEETRPPFTFFGVGPQFTTLELTKAIERAGNTPEIKAIVLRCGDMSASIAVYEEIHKALLDFRRSGKKVIAYLENPGNGEYMVASAADYIALTPNGWLGLVGLKSEMLFLRGTLEKLGMEAYYSRVGKYKSAVEPLTEDEYTEPSREAMNVLLDDVFDTLVRGIAEARGFSTGEVVDLIDGGPYIPSEAVKAGLIDTLAYWDEIPDIANDVIGAGSIGRIVPVPYGKFRERQTANRRWDEAAIGLVYGVGGITHGENRRDMWIGDIMGSETTVKALKAMRNDRSVKAVVVRIDSPGGMMTASDKIRREIELTAREKPVIVSMAGLAASGGYHVACDGTTIMADEATLTGSIGVLNLWLHTRGFYKKIGANKDILLRGKRADIFPSWRDVTEDDLKLAQYYTDKYYDRFVADVAEGRGMSAADVNSLAQGRIWSGRRARDLGLVDRIGSLNDAIVLAKREAGLDPDELVTIKIRPQRMGFFGAVLTSMTGRAQPRLELPREIEDAMAGAAYLETFDEPVLYLMPYRLEIE
jgi:protease-4